MCFTDDLWVLPAYYKRPFSLPVNYSRCQRCICILEFILEIFDSVERSSIDIRTISIYQFHEMYHFRMTLTVACRLYSLVRLRISFCDILLLLFVIIIQLKTCLPCRCADNTRSVCLSAPADRMPQFTVRFGRFLDVMWLQSGSLNKYPITYLMCELSNFFLNENILNATLSAIIQYLSTAFAIGDRHHHKKRG